MASASRKKIGGVPEDPNFGLSQLLKQASGELFIKVLRSVEGPKILIIEEELITVLDYISGGVKRVKETGVDKIYKLESKSPGTERQQCLYVIRPTLNNAQKVCDHINEDLRASRNNKYWLISTPCKLAICEAVFEREGIYEYISFIDFPLGFVPLDSDLFSLELPEFYNSYFLHSDTTWLEAAALALSQLSRIFGTFRNIYSIGKCGKIVLEMLTTLGYDHSASKKSSQISDVIIFDRDLDYVSVLLTQLTYEGLLDEKFGIKAGRVTLDKEIIKKEQPLTIQVNSSDHVFNEMRNLHISKAFTFTKEKLKTLRGKYDESQAMNISNLKDFVANELKGLKQQQTTLSCHINACEAIHQLLVSGNFEHIHYEQNIVSGFNFRENLNFIEELIHKQFHLPVVLRLLCLVSISQGGVPGSDYRNLIKLLLQSYGHKYMSTIYNLKKLGLFYDQTSQVGMTIDVPTAAKIASKVTSSFTRKGNFAVVSKKLNLIPEPEKEFELNNPTDCGYVFSGAYRPLMCKISEMIIKNEGTQGLDDILKTMPSAEKVVMKGGNIADVNSVSLPYRVILILFLGGVTYAEVAAFRLLAKLKNYHIIIATTSIINGETLMTSLRP